MHHRRRRGDAASVRSKQFEVSAGWGRMWQLERTKKIIKFVKILEKCCYKVLKCSRTLQQFLFDKFLENIQQSIIA
jgi:hypothetical protein